jgi:hypothetical protein
MIADFDIKVMLDSGLQDQCMKHLGHPVSKRHQKITTAKTY